MTIPVVVAFAGSSNTANTSYGHRLLAMAEILHNMPVYTPTFINTSNGGWATWPNLVVLPTAATANQLIFDQSNDSAVSTVYVESYIRNIWANGGKVVSVLFPCWAGGTNMADDGVISTPYNATAMAQHKALCAAYGVPVIDAYALFSGLVPGTYHLNELMADTAHLTALGFSLVEAALKPYLVTGGASQPGTLPTRIYADSEDFQNTPIRKLGTEHDSHTGTWTETGTSIASTTAGNTITFSGTFRSFGCYRADGTYPDISVSIDGGAAINPFAFYVNGYDIGTRAAHTIVITVLTTCKIDEFWAI